jgi:hypothetical protein
LPTGISLAYYGLPTFVNVAVAGGVFLWGVRDFLASRRILKFNKVTFYPFIGSDLSPQAEKSNPFVLQLKTPSQRVFVTGATGFIGSKLCKALLREGHDVTVLVRDRNKAAKLFSGVGGKLTLVPSLASLNPETTHFDVVVNLAGEPIGQGRWTKARKERMFESRVKLTEDLIEFLKKLKSPPKTLVSGSAIGYYGINHDHKDITFTEESQPLERESLSHTLCQKWEEVAMSAEKLGVRLVFLLFLLFCPILFQPTNFVPGWFSYVPELYSDETGVLCLRCWYPLNWAWEE